MCAGDFVELYRKNNNSNGSGTGGISSSGTAATAMSSDSIPQEDGLQGGGGEGEAHEEHEDGELWDAVVTCFFLDTAPVVVEYIETIHSMLRPGGVWVIISDYNSVVSVNYTSILITPYPHSNPIQSNLDSHEPNLNTTHLSPIKLSLRT